MTHRGMTILELLLALALLSGLTIACVSWTTASARALQQQGGDARWRSAAESCLQILDDALRTEPEPGDRRDRWRVAVSPDSLQVRTRAVARSESGEFLLCGLVRADLRSDRLQLTYFDAEGRPIGSRPLLGDTASVEVEALPIDNTGYGLTVRLRSNRGTRAERSWRLSREEVR